MQSWTGAKAPLPKQKSCTQGAVCQMDFIDKILEKIKEWARNIIDELLGPEAEPEPELIPIPVNEPRRRR